MVSEYDLMRKSESMDSEGISPEDLRDNADNEKSNAKRKQDYFDYYDDIKLTPKDDW